MAGSELQRFTGKDVTWIRTCVPRPEQRIDSEFFVGRDLCLDERRISRRARRIVTAGHIHFDVAETALRQMRLQRSESVGGFHVGHETHVDLRNSAMRQDCFATRACVAADESFDVHRWLRFKSFVGLLPRQIINPMLHGK